MSVKSLLFAELGHYTNQIECGNRTDFHRYDKAGDQFDAFQYPDPHSALVAVSKIGWRICGVHQVSIRTIYSLQMED